jgi:type IV secretion system protein VirD4
MGIFRRTDIAHWSTPWQLRKAGLFAREGLLLGATGGHVLRHNGPEHVLVVGTTQSRKTSSFVIPNLLTWPASVLSYDPKQEIYPATAGWRATMSRVVWLSPTSSASQCYNLLDPVWEALRQGQGQEMRQVQLISQMLLDPDGRGADHRSDAGQHFQGMAEIALNGLLLWGLRTQRARSLGAMRHLYLSQSLIQHAKVMARYPHPVIQEAGRVLTQTDGQNERSGIFSTVARGLWPYSDPLIQRATDRSDFTLGDLRERARPMSLYLGVPFGDQERLRPWVRGVIRQCCEYCVSHLDGWTWRMLGMFDEMPSLKRMSFLSDGQNYAAGFGFRLALITPTMKEIAQIYGRDHHFLEGCGVKMVCGLEDRQVADIFSGDLGDTEVKRPRKIGRNLWATERVKEPLLSGTALLGLPPEQALVMVRTTPGKRQAVVRKLYYKEHAVWHARSQLSCM